MAMKKSHIVAALRDIDATDTEIVSTLKKELDVDTSEAQAIVVNHDTPVSDASIERRPPARRGRSQLRLERPTREPAAGSKPPEHVARWTFGGRHYGVTLASTATSMDLELDDLGPGVGRGLVALASYGDEAEVVTVRVLTRLPLSLGLIEQFLAEAKIQLPVRSESAGGQAHTTS